MQDIAELIDNALLQLNRRDRYLLENNANEQSICCRLAIYLQERFPDYNVDCEYNLDCENDRFRKQIDVLEHELKRFKGPMEMNLSLIHI